MCRPGWRGCLRRGRGEGQDRSRRDRSCSQSLLSCWCCRGWCHYHPRGSLSRTSEAELSTPCCLCWTCSLKLSVNFFTNSFACKKVVNIWFLLWITEKRENFSRTNSFNVYIFISLLRRNCRLQVLCLTVTWGLHFTSQSLLLYWLWSLTVVNWWVFYETFPAAQDQTVGGWDPGKQRNHNSHCHSVTLTNLKNIENDYTRKTK